MIGTGNEQGNQISIVVATYNEADNLPALVEQVFAALAESHLEGQMVIVDDNSPDGTGEAAEELAKRYPIRVAHRPGKMGLASAIMEGLALAEGQLVGVMDADLSHPPPLLPALVEAIVQRQADLAVASRYVPGGGVQDWSKGRVLISSLANLLARPLTSIRDATSGFFLARRQVLEGVRLNPLGFKLGLEVFVKGRYTTWEEVPYVFCGRRQGKSKFTWREAVVYLWQLVALAAYRLRRRPAG